MTEQELRALVREAVARQFAATAAPRAAGASAPPHSTPVAAPSPAAGATPMPTGPLGPHLSHARFVIDRHLTDRQGAADEAGGRCVIEPAVVCTHCGYCLSYGH